MNLTLDELKKYRDTALELSDNYGWNFWDDYWDSYSGYKNVSNKLQYFLVSRLLIHMKVLPSNFKGEMVVLDWNMDIDEFIFDSLMETGEKIESLLKEVLNACGWSISTYDFHMITKHEGKSDILKELVKSGDVNKNDAKDCKKSFQEIIRLNYLHFYTVFVIRNRKIGEFLSYAKAHKKVRDSEIGRFIENLIDYAACPINLNVPGTCEIIRKKDEVVSTFAYFYDDEGEELSSFHIEPARILILGILDCAVNLAFQMFSIEWKEDENVA